LVLDENLDSKTMKFVETPLDAIINVRISEGKDIPKCSLLRTDRDDSGQVILETNTHQTKCHG
jgi:hypothetical protein